MRDRPSAGVSELPHIHEEERWAVAEASSFDMERHVVLCDG